MNTDNEKHLKQAAELLKAFETEREPERLREATLELGNIDLKRVHDVKVRHKTRSNALELWLKIVQVVDKNLDPAFDPNDVPQMNVMPPPLKSGVQLPPGAAPEAIDDPKAREEYAKAIKENRAKQENYLIQTQLRELNGQLPAKVDAFIRNAYTNSETDRTEVRAAIDKIIENEQRRVDLYRSIEPRED